MNSHTNHGNRLPISGNEGWRQMQLLLNQQLPVHSQFSKRKKWMAYVATLLLVTSGMFISIPLNKPFLFSFEDGGKDIVTVPATSKTNLQLVKKQARPKTAVKEQALLHVSGEVPETAAVINTSSKKREDNNVTTIHQPANATDTCVYPATDISVTAAVEKQKFKTNSSWNLLAGIGVNAVVGTRQDWQPYPLVVARYNINKRWYITTGLGVYSPVVSGISGISKTVNVNDTANNIQLYKEITNYNTLYYADIPLAAGMAISKKFTVQAGLQASVLLNKKSTTTTEVYDFQTPASVTLDRQSPLAFRKVDYRFVAGIRYTINKAVVGLDYQQALQPVNKGSGAGNNKVIAMSVVFTIK